MNSTVRTSITLKKAIIAGFALLLSLLAIQLITTRSASAYDGSRLIDNNLFLDSKSMTINQIQTFLESKGSGLATKTFKFDCDAEGVGTTAKNAYLAAGAPCGQTVLSSRIIYYSAQIYGLSPKVVLATLQKEQSLITNPNPSSWEYNQAMGFGCPTSGSCSDESGFFWQVDNGTWVLRFNYERANGNNSWWDNRGWVCGSAKTGYYSPSLYPYQNVDFYDGEGSTGVKYRTYYIKNAATSSMYCYTPHAFNNFPDCIPAHGVSYASWKPTIGNKGKCYSGSYNFVTAYESWFGTTQGSPLFKISGRSTYYLEWGNYYYAIPSTDILYAYGLASYAPRTLSALPSDKTRGPNLVRYAKFGSDDPNDPDFTASIYIVDDGKKHGIPNSRMMTMHGVTGYAKFDPNLAYMLRMGELLRPVVRRPNGAIYVLENNKKRGFPDWGTFSKLSGPDYQGVNEIYSKQALTNMTDAYIDSKDDGAPMLLDGKVFGLSDSPAIFLYENGEKHLFSSSTYGAWGGPRDYTFSSTVADQIPNGDEVSKLVRSSSGSLYLVDLGKKKIFGASGLNAYGFTHSDFTEYTGATLDRLNFGSKVSQLIKGSGPGVYYIDQGERHGIPSLRDFSRLGLKWTDVDTVSNSALGLLDRGADLYAPGSLLRLPNGAVYLLNSQYRAHGVTSSSLFYRYGFSWGNVYNVTEMGLSGYIFSDLEPVMINDETNEYYLGDNGGYYTISSTLASSTHFNLAVRAKTPVHPSLLSTIEKKGSMSEFIRGSSPTVYYIENGLKRPFSTEEAFYAKGGTWSKVINVSDAFLDEIPRGAKL